MGNKLFLKVYVFHLMLESVKRCVNNLIFCKWQVINVVVVNGTSSIIKYLQITIYAIVDIRVTKQKF